MKCVVCGKEMEKSKYCGNICSDECFHNDYWGSKVKDKDKDNMVRIKGEHYYIGEEDSKSSFRGFSGMKYKIKFFDGREVISTNLWYNGEIPDNFKELLPDNAEFMNQ